MIVVMLSSLTTLAFMINDKVSTLKMLVYGPGFQLRARCGKNAKDLGSI